MGAFDFSQERAPGLILQVPIRTVGALPPAPVDPATVPAEIDSETRPPTPLESVRMPFAKYLELMHDRIHPIFADTFLASLHDLPAEDARNAPDLHTGLEIVLGTDGDIVHMEVIERSGVPEYDAGVLRSMLKAGPFGAPPREIVSRDGKVYLHWTLWRNPYWACSTYFVRPFFYPPVP